MEMITEDSIVSWLLDVNCITPGYIIKPEMLHPNNVLFFFQL